jgi:transcriptional regulator with XRE-family HTH domain
VGERRVSGSEHRLRRRIATNVRRLRKELKLSAISASESVGLHWRLWQKVEAGDNNMTLATLIRVAEALDVDPRELLA